MTDSIQIEGLVFSAHLGCTAAERAFPQKVKADITIFADLAACLVSDSLSDTPDYLAISRAIETLARDGSWNLLEKLAHDIGMHVIESFPLVQMIQVRVRKSIQPNAEGFSASITCRRS